MLYTIMHKNANAHKSNRYTLFIFIYLFLNS